MCDLKVLKSKLQSRYIGRELYFFDKISSTNDFLRLYAGHLGHGATAISNAQFMGRGRRSGRWLSCGKSLALSVLFHLPKAAAPIFTLVSAVAVAKALNFAVGSGFKIKWPNDIVKDGKKVCGILCESATRGEKHFLVCGIGVNLSGDRGSFCSNGLENAGSIYELTGVSASTETTAAAIINELEYEYEKFKEGKIDDFLLEYQSRCVTIGSSLRLKIDGTQLHGTGLRVNPDGSLAVVTGQGVRSIFSDEAVVRGVNGYV